MATRAQTKIIIDNVSALVKADIDAFLPSGVNITDGGIRFNPARWTIQMAEPNRAAALALASSIQALLTTGGKTFTVNQARRVKDAKFITITYDLNALTISFP